MENKSHALITGLFTLILLAAAVAGGVWFNRDRSERIPYLLASNQALSGLNPQAPVRYRGLMVGRVKQIRFDPDKAGQLLIEIGVNPDTPITASTFATLGYQGVTGLAFIQLDDDGSKPQRLSSSVAQMTRLPLRPGTFQMLELHAKQILLQSEELVRRSNMLLAQENQQKIIGTIEKFGRVAERLEAVPGQLQPTLERLPPLADSARASLQSVQALAQDARALTQNLNRVAAQAQGENGLMQQAGQGLQQIKSIGAELETETLPRLHAVGDESRHTLRQLNKSVQQFNERPQSLLFGPAPIPPGPGEAGFIPPKP
ncbi:MlaD family protein [Massilia sp. W12]|uniref:MlaD family protein n=1 Tax=Massilia sp. W12 TaxID=3126507 RepID=UPI0030CE4291